MNVASDVGAFGVENLLTKTRLSTFAVQRIDEAKHEVIFIGPLKLDQIALLRLQGFSADEIAEQIGELRRTVYRRLELIRSRWQESLGPEVAIL